MDWLTILQQFNSVEGVNAFLDAQLARYPQVQGYVEWVRLAPEAPADATLVLPLSTKGGNVLAVKGRGVIDQVVRFAASYLAGLPARV